MLYDKATRKLVASSDASLFSFFGYDPSDTSLMDLRKWLSGVTRVADPAAANATRVDPKGGGKKGGARTGILPN